MSKILSYNLFSSRGFKERSTHFGYTILQYSRNKNEYEPFNYVKLKKIPYIPKAGVNSESPRAHVAKFYGRLFFRIKINGNCNFVGLLHHPFWLKLVLELSSHDFQLLNYFVWPRITDEGSLLEMRIWSILLIKSDLKWRIHLRRSLFSYFLCVYYRNINILENFCLFIRA